MRGQFGAVAEAAMARTPEPGAAVARAVDWILSSVELEDALQAPRLPARLANATLDGYGCPPGDQKALEAVRRYRPAHGAGLYLHGKVGGGKSHLAAAVAREWTTAPTAARWWVDHYARRMPAALRALDPDEVAAALEAAGPVPRRPFRVVWSSVPGYLRRLQEHFGDPRGVKAVTRDMMHADLLVLDDLGAERVSDWTQAEMFALLEERTAELRATVITSNLSLPDLVRRYPGGEGERLASRIIGACEVVPVNAQGDYRAKGRA